MTTSNGAGAGVPAVGLLPRGNTPAAWWYSDDPEVLSASQQFETDLAAWWEAFPVFAQKYGADPTQAAIFEGVDLQQLRGLYPLDRNRIPEGWRYERAKGRMVPIRKTKADRESQANRDLKELARVPFLPRYLRGLGMPAELWLMGQSEGRIYPTDFRRLPGSEVVVALQGADPDRLDKSGRRQFVVNADRWKRLPLSAFHEVREDQGGDES